MASNSEDRFEVRHAEAERVLKQIGEVLRGAMPPGYGFALLVFSYGPGGNLFYTASADREGVIGAMQEFAAKLREN
jgi:hypothetical protein